MKIELSGKEFTLRADFLALKKAKDEAGIKLSQLTDDPVEAGTLVYYMAQSGHKTTQMIDRYTKLSNIRETSAAKKI